MWENEPTPEPRRADLDEDITPRPAIYVALMAWALSEWGKRLCALGRPIRVLDFGAGYGAWSSVLRIVAAELGFEVVITSLEVNAAREVHLRKWCNEVVVSAYPNAMLVFGVGKHREFDLIMGNPPFAWILGKGKRWSETTEKWINTVHLKNAADTLVPSLLRHTSQLLILHQIQSLAKSITGRKVMRDYPRSAAWVLGPLGFRDGSAMDSYSYTATLWQHSALKCIEAREACPAFEPMPCPEYMVEELTADQRRWSVDDDGHRVIPGSESLETARANGWPLAPGEKS